MSHHGSVLPVNLGESGHEAVRGFGGYMQAAIAQERRDRGSVDQSVLAATADLLSAHGLPPDLVDPAAVPARLNDFSEEDWQYVHAKEAEVPGMAFLALWSRANARAASWLAPESFDVTRYDKRADIERVVAGEVLWRTAPITHSTTAEALEMAFRSGHFISSREAMDAHGIDYEWEGRTYADDREMGIDGCVFGNYPRPHTFYMGDQQSPVIAVLSNDAMHQPGTFITSDELEEDHLRGSTEGRTTSYEHHMATLALPEDFEAVARRALHALNGRGGVSLAEVLAGADLHPAPPYENIVLFSAFEVKMPRTPTSLTRKLIFRNQDDADAFVERNGEYLEGIAIEVIPDLRVALRHDSRAALGFDRAYDDAYQAALAEDSRIRAFDERMSTLGADGVKREAIRRFLGM